jgi:hypothetical protein
MLDSDEDLLDIDETCASSAATTNRSIHQRCTEALPKEYTRGGRARPKRPCGACANSWAS